MKIAFNPSTVAALIAPPNNKDITFDLRGHNIFARGVKFCGTDTNTWRDIKINNVSIGSNILDLRDGDNTTLTNINGVVAINSTWRPVVDNLTSDSTTSSLSANQGRVLARLINTLSTNISNQYALRDGSNATGRWRGGLACLDVRDTNYTPYDLNMGLELHFFDNNTNNLKDGGEYNGVFSFRQWASGSDWSGGKAHQLSFTDNGNIWHRTSSGDDSWGTWKKLAYSTDIPSSLKSPYSLTTFGVVYDGSSAKTVTTSTFVSQLSEGTSTVTDGTMFITSWASDNGFADTNAVNVPYKRKAIHLWEYIKAKTDSLYATRGHNHDDRYLKLTGGTMSGTLSFSPTDASDAAPKIYSTVSDGLTSLNFEVSDDENDRFVFKINYWNDINNHANSERFIINWNNVISKAPITAPFFNGTSTSATKLQTPRTIWGQSFDGTGDVSGSLSGVGHIQFSADNSYSIGTTTSEAAHTYTRQVWARHLNASRVYTGDTNLYIGYSNTAQVKFYSGTKQSGDGSNERMTILTNGNVGIGTTSPQMKLHVNGNGIYLNSTATCGINMYSSHSESSISYKSSGGIRTVLGTYTNRTFLWNESIGEHVSILSSNGYFGIGTTNPSYKLSVGGDIGTGGNIYISHATNNNMNYNTSNPRIVFSENGDQAVGLVYTDYDSYRASKGLKVMDVDNNDTGNVWFEVQGYNYSSGYVKNGSSDSYVLLGGGGHSKITDLSVANADTVDGYHANSLLTALSNSDNGISITVGGTTKSVSNISVNYASSAGNADTVDYYHADSLFRDLGWWNYNDTHDADNISGNGAVFAYAEHSNVPNTGVLVTFKGGDDGYRWQMSKSYWSKSLHIRQRNGDNGTWSNWLRLLDESDLIWDNIAGKPSSFTPSAHSHSWTSITDKIVAGNEFNIVNAGFNAGMWFNYLPINDRSKTATITGYHFGNGATGYTSITASGFVKNGSSSNYVLLGDGGHQTISSLSVNYANSAGNADTAQYLRSLGNQNCQTGRTQNYGDVYTYNTYANNTGAPTDYTSVIGFGRGTAGTVEIAGGWCNSHLYWRSLRDCCEDWYSWRVVLDSSNYTEFINNYYWADVKISTSSSTTTSPTVSNLTATNSIRMGNILLEHTDEINNSTNGGIHLNYRNSGNITLCYGGGNVGIETPSPTYKLDVNGQVRASGFRHSSVNSDNYMLLAGGGYKSFGGDSSHPVFLGYLNLDHGSDGTVSSSFYCLGYSVPFTYTRGGNYCRISIPDTSYQVFYIKAAIASVNYSGGGMDTWTGNRRGDGAWWLHCYASSSNEVRVKGFRLKDTNNDSWWGGNPLIPDSGGANRITVCIFGYVSFR